MKRFFFIVAIMGIVILTSLFTYCEFTENPVANYATYGDAVHADALERGWLPAFVPATATHIREIHNIDTNRQWLQFRLPELDAREMVAGMRSLSNADVVNHWRVPWPRRIAKNSGSLNNPETKIFIHEESGRSYCVAVEWSSETVYTWTCLS